MYQNFIYLYGWSVVWIYHVFLIHSCVDGHLGSLHLLATMNIGVCMCVSIRIPVFSSFFVVVKIHLFIFIFFIYFY